jgi:hypothetical protein
MKRLLVIVAAIAAAALIVWLASGTASEEPASQTEAARPPSRPSPPAEVQPRGFTAEPPPAHGDASARAAPAAPEPEKASAIDVLPGSIVAGTVVRASDGSPLDAVTVIALADDAQRGTTELARTTTKAGRFSFGPEVSSRGPRFLNFAWTAPVPKGSKQTKPRVVESRVTLADQRDTLDRMQVALDTGWMVKGRVTDGDGKPLAGVAIERVGGTGAASDGDGDFQLRDIAPEETSVSLKFMARGHRTQTLVVAPTAGQHWTEVAAVLDKLVSR